MFFSDLIIITRNSRSGRRTSHWTLSLGLDSNRKNRTMKQLKGAPCSNTGYLHTFRAQSKVPDVIHTSMEPEEELNSTLKRFWDLETVDIGVHNQEEIELTPHENIAQKKVEQSLTYHGEC